MKSLDGITKTSTSTKPSNKVETFKTVLITILVTAIISFLFGMHVANANNASKQAAVKSATAQLK